MGKKKRDESILFGMFTGRNKKRMAPVLKKLDVLEKVGTVWEQETSENTQEFARKTLIEFYELYQKIVPRATITVDPMRGYFGYRYNLWGMKEQLEIGDYIAACHKLDSLIVLDEIEEKRTKAAIIAVMKKYMISKENNQDEENSRFIQPPLRKRKK